MRKEKKTRTTYRKLPDSVSFLENYRILEQSAFFECFAEIQDGANNIPMNEFRYNLFKLFQHFFHLDTRESVIFFTRILFPEITKMTLEEVGGILGMTREAIRHIEIRVKKKIAYPKYVKLFEQINNFSEYKKKYKQLEQDYNELKQKYEPIPIKPHILDTLVDDLYRDGFDISNRLANCLQEAQIKTVGDLIKWKPEQLLNLPNFGRKSLDEAKDILKEHGLFLAK